MELTKKERKFLINLLNNYADDHRIYDNVYTNKDGELSELDFEHQEIHTGLDIDNYQIIVSLLDKLC